MNSEQNLIDSFLGFGIESSGGLAEMNSTGNDGRLENGEDTRFRRPSDPKSPVSADSSKFVSPPTGVGGILEASLDQQLNSNSTSEYDHSPQRYAEQKEAFTNDTFTLGAISRFNNDEDNQSSGRFASGGTIEGASYVIHEPSDVAGLAPLGQLSSKDLAAGDHNHFNNYDPGLSRSGGSGGGSGAGANRDMFSQPSDSSSPHGYPQLSQMSPRNAQAPQDTQFGAASQQQFQQNAPQQMQQNQQQQQQQTQQTQQNQRYPQGVPPQQHQQQYPRGNRPLQQQAPMGILPQESYYAATASPDPYGGYKPAPAPYANKQYVRPQHGYGSPMPDPYAGYGVPAAAPAYGAPRYGKPAHHAPHNMGYRAPFGGRDMPSEQQLPDPYQRGGYPPPPPPGPYGYAGGYPQPQPHMDPYFNTGAAAVNRVLGRPGHGGGYGGDNFGPPSYRSGGGGGGGGSRFRNSLPMAEHVNLDNVDMSTIVYQVQFKKTIRNYTLRPGDLTPVQIGDFVVVQADRGEDLGVITEAFPLQTFLDRRYAMRAYMDEEDQNVGYILRIASPSETKLLPEKFQDEEMIFKTCENLAIHTYRLPMTVVDVEYQFDRHKITIYYDSPLRIDFRELVRDLFSSFKARIWMKKINQFHAPDIQHFAAIALATGVQFAAPAGSD